MAVAHSQGLFDYDARVVTYWPEFAQHGKQYVTLRQLLAHEAGLCAIDEPLDSTILADPDALAAILARQKPAWEPGTRHGYHAFSLGWYESEIIRRTDPRHRPLGHFFQDEIAKPLGLEFYIGLPKHIPEKRLATLTEPLPAQKLLGMPTGMMLSALLPGSLTRRIANPRIRSNLVLNQLPYRAVEMPSVNGIGQVRSMARAYSSLATRGQELGLQQKNAARTASSGYPFQQKRLARCDPAHGYCLLSGLSETLPWISLRQKLRRLWRSRLGWLIRFRRPRSRGGLCLCPEPATTVHPG